MTHCDCVPVPMLRVKAAHPPREELAPTAPKADVGANAAEEASMVGFATEVPDKQSLISDSAG
eukprot:2315362-Pleurochrysis_carterae.AAC.1